MSRWRRTPIRTDITETLIEELRQAFGQRLQRIILFGSRARGQATEESDYDFLLVFDSIDPDVEEKVGELADRMLLEEGAVISAFPLSVDDLERLKFEPFLLNAQREGVTL